MGGLALKDLLLLNSCSLFCIKQVKKEKEGTIQPVEEEEAADAIDFSVLSFQIPSGMEWMLNYRTRQPVLGPLTPNEEIDS